MVAKQYTVTDVAHQLYSIDDMVDGRVMVPVWRQGICKLYTDGKHSAA